MAIQRIFSCLSLRLVLLFVLATIDPADAAVGRPAHSLQSIATDSHTSTSHLTRDSKQSSTSYTPDSVSLHKRNETTTTMANPGILHQYAPGLVAFEFTTPNTTPHSANALLFVGGLTDGLLTVPYVQTLASNLTSDPTNTWSIFNVLLTTSYQGWGVNSLDRDVEEIAQCVNYVRKLKGPNAKIVIMGHSTGSQDVLHYLSASNPVAYNPDVNGLKYITRPRVDGAIMQAPMSDRQGLQLALTNAETIGAYEQLVSMARITEPRTLLPLNLTGTVGFDPETPMNAWRFLSLASPDSPQHPRQDDLFSSDLSDQRLLETFGVVGERGLLGYRLMTLYSGNDEYATPELDMPLMLKRWENATNTGAGEIKWDAQGSAVIPGATHNVQDVGQAELVERVRGYLGRCEQTNKT